MEVFKSKRFLTSLTLFGAMAVLSRLLPHPPNMAAVGALALFAGAHGKSKWYILAPLLVMALTDPILGFYEGGIMAGVYGSLLLMGILGWWVKKHVSGHRVLAAGVAGEILFFLITNWAVWAFSPMYAKTLGGLLESYLLALPFFRNSLAGTLVYTGIFFGVYELAKSHQRTPQTAKTAEIAAS
ncbi:MAG: hypothetical protein Q7J22_01415 [Candidatus Wolfebacteria bacterium]|nr:hypothetical protein [Candidatus Wolfebacteria bacterium]MDP2704377.1 hypothetical protein [bacterium]